MSLDPEIRSDPDIDGLQRALSYQELLAELARERERTVNLELALRTNRDIGTAMGIVMVRMGLTAELAFEVLRKASQQTHRKLAEVAADVVYTGSQPHLAQRPPAGPDVKTAESRPGSTA
jgi:AmiR/NasT family two-component response regulator